MLLTFAITVLVFTFLFRLWRICTEFHMLYCRFCQDVNVLRKNFWEKLPEKLPNEVSITNLMLDWDKLHFPWNNIDILACILPNKANEIAILNSRRFTQHPIERWDSIHKDLVKCVFIFVGVCFYLFIEQWDSVRFS